MKMTAVKFTSFLASKKLKLTRERDEIFRTVLITKSHFAPDDLFLKMKTNGSKVSRASVYRTIPLLVESGLIEEVERVDKHAHYERIPEGGHHDHMICLKCGRVIEFYSEGLEELQDILCRQKNFRGLRHCLEIHGVCKKCDSLLP
jgi:Fur family transcriptional regulator, ferric uptake regulator